MTEGFYVHGKTGAWEYLAPEMDGTYTLNYLITVNDLVLGGWVYPLGDKGVYTIECSIVVSVKNGIPATGGGGAGDTSQLPEVVGENSIEHLAGEVQEESFIIDTKGNEIISVKLGSENVKLEAYALADVDGGKKITFKADFMALLSVGDKEFIISTEKGSVSVYVIVFESVEPTIEGENTVSMDKNDEKDAQFNLDTGKLAITMILRSGLKALNGDAYTYQDGVLTIKKEYLATLSPELYEFYVYTKGGYTTVKVEIKESLPPMAEETLKNYALGSLQDVEFTLYTFELDILQILRNGAEKALNSDAYTFTFDAESGLLTFKGEYLSTLGQGACTFTVSTAGGDVELTINISGNAPTCSENQKAAKYGEATDVSFNVNTKGLDVIAIQRKGADYGLNNSAYTFENNKLTLLGKYVALLELGKHEFVLETEGGTVSLYLDIKEEFEPDVEKPDDPEKPDEPEIPDNPDNPESPDNPDGREDFEEDENPFEEDINSPSDDGDDNPSQPDTNPEDQKPSGDGSSYEEVFTGIVKPDEEAYNKYLEGLESGGQVSSGCDSSLSVMAGLPIVGVIAWFIRKKKEN